MNTTTTTMNASLATWLGTTSATHPSSVMTIVKFFFNHVYLLLLVVVGGIGNCFVIIIFRQRTLRGTIGSNMSVYPFLFYMAISDTIYLFILFCLWLTRYVNILHRPIICQSTLYLTYVCNFINAYYTVSFTAQRLFAVVKPFRVSQVLSWHRSRSLALLIILIACLIYSYLLFLTGIVRGYCFSLDSFRRFSEIMDVLDSILVFLVPYLMIMIMNTIILISLKRMKKTENNLLFQTSTQLNQIRRITQRIASRKMTQLLLTVSTSYLLVGAPYACLHTWRLLFPQGNSQSKILDQLEQYFHLIYHISFAMNFYIYILFGAKFRRELRRYFLKCQLSISHCFRREHSYENESSDHRHESSTLEQQLQMMDRTPSYSTLTTMGPTIGYRV